MTAKTRSSEEKEPWPLVSPFSDPAWVIETPGWKHCHDSGSLPSSGTAHVTLPRVAVTATDKFLASSRGAFCMRVFHGICTARSGQNFALFAHGWALRDRRHTITGSLWVTGGYPMAATQTAALAPSARLAGRRSALVIRIPGQPTMARPHRIPSPAAEVGGGSTSAVNP